MLTIPFHVPSSAGIKSAFIEEDTHAWWSPLSAKTKKKVVMRHLTRIEIVMSREGDKLLRVILKDFVQEISNHHLTHFVAAQMSHTMLRNMVLPRIQ